TSLHTSSTTCVVTSSDIGDVPARREDEPAVTRLSSSQAHVCSVAQLPTGLRLAQLTVKREPAPDTLLSALLATSLALVISGVFFARVESITIAGVGIGIGRRDRKNADKAVDRVVDTLPQEVPPGTVERTKRATQRKAVELREYAVGERIAPPIDVP